MTKTPKEIYDHAVERAEKALVASLLTNDADRGMCGGAYTIIRPARGPFVKWCKENGLGDRGVYGGWEVSCPVRIRSQNIDIHIDVERAFVDALREHGVTASMKNYVD